MFGRIPRFSPSFSPREALTAARHLAVPGDEAATITTWEQSFAGFIGARHAITVPSARYGFYLLLEAAGVGPGDEVILPALTYFAIPAMVPLLGARPVFADVGLRSHVLDPEAFRRAITPRTKAVVPTHLFGTPCDMDAIRAIAHAHGITVIEDCAQSTGARYKGQRVGHLGDHAYYTFGLTKNITTLCGAMVTTDDDRVAARIRATVDAGGQTPVKKAAKEAAVGAAMWAATHPFVYWAALDPVIRVGNALGKDPIHQPFGEPEVRYERLSASYAAQSRPLGAQAAVGLRQLARIEALNGARSRNGRALDAGLAHVPGLVTPTYPEGAEPIYMSFVVHHPRRDALAAALRARGVDTTTGYMNAFGDHPLFPEFRADCPNAAEAVRTFLHLPVHPNLRPADVSHIIEATRAACLEVGAG